jgi:hypothetical protein
MLREANSLPRAAKFITSVIGAALSSTVLIRKRPSDATSYCRLWPVSSPPPPVLSAPLLYP